MEESTKPELMSASFTFSQEGNCVDGGSGEYEELTLRCESSLGIDNDRGCFYVLETKKWSIDSTSDLQELFDRIDKTIKK